MPEREEAMMDTEKRKLELTRANIGVRSQAAIAYLGLRVRRMFDELWTWLFAHYRKKTACIASEEVILDVREFKRLLSNCTGPPEELDHRLRCYCSGHPNRFSLCLLMASMQTDRQMAASTHRINEHMMRLHRSILHSLCTVPVCMFDQYWSHFIVAVGREAHSLLEDPSSDFYSRQNTPLATSYLKERFRHLLNKFYWDHVQQLTSQQHNDIFNEHDKVARNSLRTMLHVYSQSGVADDAFVSTNELYVHHRQRRGNGIHVPDMFAIN